MKHDGPVSRAHFDKAEARILSWSADATIRLWDAATGQPHSPPMKHDGSVGDALFDQAEARILSWSVDQTIWLWDAATGQPIGGPMRDVSRARFFGARFDQAEVRILSWSKDIRIWDIARLMHGNLIEVGCGLLTEKDIKTLQKDFAIRVDEPICTNKGEDAPAPRFDELRD
jgi:WD40 repeat protein